VLTLYTNQIYFRESCIVRGFYTVDNLKTFDVLSSSRTASTYTFPRPINYKKNVKYKHLAVTSYVIFILNFLKYHNIFQNSEGHAHKQHDDGMNLHLSLRKETGLRGK
jgi:hypothetical protein